MTRARLVRKIALRSFGYIGVLMGYMIAVSTDADWTSFAIFAPCLILFFTIFCLIDWKRAAATPPRGASCGFGFGRADTGERFTDEETVTLSEFRRCIAVYDDRLHRFEARCKSYREALVRLFGMVDARFGNPCAADREVIAQARAALEDADPREGERLGGMDERGRSHD